MCGIAALQLKNEQLRPELGTLLTGMLCQIIERGPDSAGMAVYSEPGSTHGSTVSLLGTRLGITEDSVASLLGKEQSDVAVREVGGTTFVTADVAPGNLADTLHAAFPGVVVTGRGKQVSVMKSVGNPRDVAKAHDLESMSGTQAVAHTRMATESAVTASGSHPFAVDDDLCLVHNGSFSNHATVRRELMRLGVEFDSQNDTEVGARFIAHRLAAGDDLEVALEALGNTLDGFYTLVVTTKDSMAIVRDPIACKPAIVAETDDYVAMASEYRALAHLPGIESACLFEPEPGRIYTWSLDRTPVGV